MSKKIRRAGKLLYVAGKKIAKGQTKDFYRGRSLRSAVKGGTRYLRKHGPRAFWHRFKHVAREMYVVSQLGTTPFSNGLVRTIPQSRIEDWFTKHGRKVTIVIPSYNDFDVLKPCVESIRATANPHYYRILIVDDYCEHENKARLETLRDENTDIIYREKNGGFALAVNTGLKAADNKHDVILVNSDIVAHQGWFESLQYGAYEFDKKVGIVGPKLLYPDGRIQFAGGHRNLGAPEWFDHYYRFKPSQFGPANIPQYVLTITGALMYIKRPVIDAIGYLDEKFPFAFEDVDFCLRAWEAGFRMLYFPFAELTHHESVTRSKNKTISEKERGSVVRFWQKWGDWFDKRNVRTPDGKLKIIYVLHTTGISGGHRIVFEHVNRLKSLGHQVELWSIDKDPKWYKLEAPHRSFKSLQLLSEALEKEEAIKVATWWETAMPVWLGSVTKGIPVYFIQELETWFYPKDVPAQQVVLSCYRKEFRNLTTSQYNLTELEQIEVQAKAIPCGIDMDVFKPLKDVARKENVLLAAGRRFFQKNFDFTFKTWKELGPSRPDMWLYGFEKDMATMDPKITYYDRPSDEEVNKLYNQATAFAQTSYHEGFALPPLEAMAAGCPVICTDAHGNRDYIEDGKNCLVVEQDNVSDLKRAYQRVFSDARLRGKLSRQGIKTARMYGWPRVIDRLEAYYEQVAAQPFGRHIEKVLR